MKKENALRKIVHTTGRLMAASMLVLLGTAALAVPAQAVETITYYHLDALGSPVAATDEQGNVKWREEYKPYGERIKQEAGAQANSRWYTGHPHDDATGLTYMGARYYDPVVGRFMAVDPVGFTEDNIHSFGRYGYANDNPYSFIDPDGEEAVSAGVAAKLNLNVFNKYLPYPLQFSGGVEYGVVVSWPGDSPGDNGRLDIGAYKTNLTGASAAIPSGVSIVKGLKGAGAVEIGVTKTRGTATDIERFDSITTWNVGYGGKHTVNLGRDEVGRGYHVGPGWEYGGYATNTEVWSARRGISTAAEAAVVAIRRAAADSARRLFGTPMPVIH